MNAQSIGKFIENYIKERFKLHDSKIGFDGCCNGREYEIKGCIPTHKNGVNRNGRDRITKGRFWIDNDAHKLLLERKGFYIFVIYYMAGGLPTILEYTYKSALAVNKLIKTGANTKIRYDIILPDDEAGRV